MKDRLFAIRTGRHERDRGASNLGEARQVLSGGLGKVLPLRNAEGAFLPAGKFLVDGFAFGNRHQRLRA